MDADDWLGHTRTSYGTVAASYCDQLRDAIAGKPYLRAALALFADLARREHPGLRFEVGSMTDLSLGRRPARVLVAGPHPR